MDDLRLHDAVIFLTAAGLVVPLVKRLRVSPVLGFLLVGLAVGPYGLARFTDTAPWLSMFVISDVAGIHAIAELGVIFLLFMIGLELSFERLWGMRRLVFGLGGLQVLLTGLVIGGIAYWFGNSVEASVVLGGCLALSSTAIVIQLLTEQNRFGSAVGRGAFGILLAQDIAVVPILFMVGVFGAGVASGSDSSVLPALGLALGEAAIAVAAILGVGRLVVRPLFRFVGASNSPELFMAITLLTVIATAVATHAAGLSAALGAFLAGLLLAESEYRHEIEINIEPFKGLLLGLFFISVSMTIDLAAIAAEPVWIPLSVVGLFALKCVITSLLARGFGYPWPASLEIGLLLGQGGEFAFVVVAMALTFTLVPQETAQFMLIVVGATMFLTPLVARLGNQLNQRLSRMSETAKEQDTEPSSDISDHVVVVGYGRTGQLLADLLNRQQVSHIGLDMDQRRVSKLQSEGAPVYLGDASRRAMLDKVGLAKAAALAICTDDPGATQDVIVAARRDFPNITILARARDPEHARELLDLGATDVIPEVLESGLQLGQTLLTELGVPLAAAREVIDIERFERIQALSEGSAKPAGDQ
ncbi:MAG: cation:proton antiporter [Pseudomonadaceae bacterium]|nr:cation:proton antiporter [Pseudomonadaceae bacterium]